MPASICTDVIIIVVRAAIAQRLSEQTSIHNVLRGYIAVPLTMVIELKSKIKKTLDKNYKVESTILLLALIQST